MQDMADFQREAEGIVANSGESSSLKVSWIVEQDKRAFLAGDTALKAFCSAVVTLTLGVLGSSVLPIPFALSKTGVLLGCSTMALVAFCNDLTSCLLIRAAAVTGKDTYEGLAEWAGGTGWKVLTQASLVLLLWGTLCGGLALLSDVGFIFVHTLFEDTAPYWWLSGRTVMSATALLVLFPLCLQRHMRQLDKAATAGVVVVVALIALLGTKAVQEGFPAIVNGELPLWQFQLDGHLPEAFAVVGYAFYMQPMMMPLLKEMPPGMVGVVTMRRAVHATLYGVAFLVYASMGVFGAALFGQQTAGNIMVNQLVNNRLVCSVLYGSMLVYLALGMTTTQYALRASLDLMIWGEEATFTWRKQVMETMFTVGSSLAVALTAPHQAEKIFAVVGASAVCVVCYVIPVYIHYRVVQREAEGTLKALVAPTEERRGRRILTDEEATAPLIYPSSPHTTMVLPHSPIWWRMMVPVVVLLVGVCFSVAALFCAIRPLLMDV